MIRIFYDCSRVDQDTVQIVLRHYETLLQLMSSTSHGTVAQLKEALDEADKQEEMQRRKNRKEARREKLKRTERKSAGSLTE
jgi:hypothetical protein